MKVIDLLNKIANGEEVPKHIHIRDVDSYTWQKDVKAYWSDRDENNLLSDLDLSSTDLKEEVEILEEKKIPEKSILDVDSDANGSYDTVIINGAEYQISRVERYMLGKINEIIDYINGGTNGE